LPQLGAVIGTAEQNGKKFFRIFHMKLTSIPMEVDQKMENYANRLNYCKNQ